MRKDGPEKKKKKGKFIWAVEGYDFVKRPEGRLWIYLRLDSCRVTNTKRCTTVASGQTVKLTLTISWTTCLLTSCTDSLCIDWDALILIATTGCASRVPGRRGKISRRTSCSGLLTLTTWATARVTFPTRNIWWRSSWLVYAAVGSIEGCRFPSGSGCAFGLWRSLWLMIGSSIEWYTH